MKVEELMNSKVSLYKKVTDNRSFMTITLDDWLHKASINSKGPINRIRETNKTDEIGAKAMKKANLPCVTISAVFEEERRSDKVTSENPIICIDIDELPFAMTWEEVKKKVFELPYVFYVSLSARGEGIFALIHYNNKHRLLDVFRALEEDFRKMNIIIDSSCKDICRLRFVSYDENALEKTGDIQMYDKVKKAARGEDVDPWDAELLNNFNKIDDYLMYLTIMYLIEHCNYRADSYDDWLLEGFRLATFGEYGHTLFMYLSQVSEGYNELEAERKWRRCVKETKMNMDCLLHYFDVAKKTLGPDWRRIIRNR